jgi:hypothetical protein
MELTENNRLSPYEFDLTAESVPTFHTYGQPFSASLRCSGTAVVPAVGVEQPTELGDVLEAPRIGTALSNR